VRVWSRFSLRSIPEYSRPGFAEQQVAVQAVEGVLQWRVVEPRVECAAHDAGAGVDVHGAVLAPPAAGGADPRGFPLIDARAQKAV
jgi:hypothetical protein